MALLESRVERTDDFARRQSQMEQLVEELRERSALDRGRRRRARRRTAPRTRQAARARAHRPARRPGHRVPGAERARGVGDLRRPGAERRRRHGHRRRRRARVRDRRERRDRQGRLVLPAHRQEAPTRPGGRGAEPAPVPLPRRLRRCVPAAAGRGVPGSRPLRPHLLQPGSDVGEGHPADRGRDGLVHRGRRVRAGDERRDGDRPRHGHDLHRRAAAREGGDRPGRERRGARRRRRARAAVGRRRPLRDERRARARDRPAHRRERAHAASRICPGRERVPSSRSPTRPTSTD